MVLKRVLLAFARWNKSVGYCQGFNVLAALILEVTEGDESDALKVRRRQQQQQQQQQHTITDNVLTALILEVTGVTM